MAWTATAAAISRNKYGFLSGAAGDAAGCEDIQAAVANKTLVVKKIWLTWVCTADTSIDIGSGENTSAVKNKLIGPILIDTGLQPSGQMVFEFENGIRLVEGEALTIDSGANTTLCVLAEGTIE